MRETQLRRFASGTAVLLLHLGLLSALFLYNFARTAVIGPIREIEIRFPAVVRKQNPLPAPALLPQFVSPYAPALPAIPGQLLAPPLPAAPAPGAISGVGRALFGCDPHKIDLLSPQDRAACLRMPSGKSAPQNVRMSPPPDPNSPFTREIEERFREAEPIDRPCPLGSFNDTYGLPCFGFNNKSALQPHD